jgi:hypothetical protein
MGFVAQRESPICDIDLMAPGGAAAAPALHLDAASKKKFTAAGTCVRFARSYLHLSSRAGENYYAARGY